MSGEEMDLSDDNEILSINSPKNLLGGPYRVVYKNIEERWAIVAMDWDKKPCLGIRWFWGSAGNPFSSGYPTWLVIPSGLTYSILNGLPLDFNFRNTVEKYLKKELSGEKFRDINNV